MIFKHAILGNLSKI